MVMENFRNLQRKQCSEHGTLTGASAKSQTARRSTVNVFRWASCANLTSVYAAIVKTQRKMSRDA